MCYEDDQRLHEYSEYFGPDILILAFVGFSDAIDRRFHGSR